MAFNPLQNFLGGQQAGRQQQAFDISGRLAQSESPQLEPEFQRLMQLDPERAKQLMQLSAGGDALRTDAQLKDSKKIKYLLDIGDTGGAYSVLKNRKQALGDRAGPGTDHMLKLADVGDWQGVSTGMTGFINAFDPNAKKDEGKGTKQAEFENLVKLAEVDPKGKTIAGKAALTSLGLVARASNSAAERIATNPELAQAVAKSEELKAESKETGKSKAQLNFKPQIESAVKLAAIEAESRGEALTDLARLEATMPEMQKVVGQLRELSEISTSTMGGRFFDTMVKETGFGATKGGTARSKLISIINNQVLPLLKDTFGGAMTETEGDKLAATMGDPNSTHESRMAALDAFIDQKVGAIMSLKREVSKPLSAGSLSDEDLLRKYQ